MPVLLQEVYLGCRNEEAVWHQENRNDDLVLCKKDSLFNLMTAYDASYLITAILDKLTDQKYKPAAI